MQRKHPTAARSTVRRAALPSLGAVLIESLQLRWEKYRTELARAKKAPTEETIHDLRVATRRLISTLKIVELLIPDGEAERLRRRLKKLFDACSPLRDTQVQLLALETEKARYPDLDLLVTILKVRERDLIAVIAKKANKVPVATWGRAVNGIARTLREQFSHPLMQEAATAIVLGAAARTFAAAVYFTQRVVPADPSTIHRARIAFKKFRYTMEALAPLLPHLDKDRMKALDTYQTRMGIIQDAELLGQVVERYAAKRSPASRRNLAAFQRRLLGQKKERIAAYMKARDELYTFWQPASELQVRSDGTR